ncbi:MAG: hypothetical protein Q4D46_11460, partial [Erysipelotrichaceae bacterium]|nr:hypothetical protein [Erysipelotrichaceae bacterium]
IHPEKITFTTKEMIPSLHQHTCSISVHDLGIIFFEIICDPEKEMSVYRVEAGWNRPADKE